MKRVVIIVAGVLLGSMAGWYLRRPAHDGGGGLPEGEAREMARRPATIAAGDDAPEHRRPLPRFAAPEGAQVETDPSSPDYDPTKLSAVGVRLPEIVAAEPRIGRWAAPMEKMLSARVAADLGHYSDRARLVGVECRSSSCTIKVDAPEADVRDVHMGLQVVRPGDVFTAPMVEEAEEKGWRRLSMPVLFAKQTRDVEVAARLQQRRRQTALEELRNDASILTQAGLDPKKLPPIHPSAD